MVPATGPGEIAADWSVFERARRGDEEAWRDLTARYQARLTALALFVTRSPTVAEDVVQETFLRALRFYGGHSYEEIALLLRVPLGTVKSRIFHGVQHCRKMISEKGLLE
jgi:DNA-directed RNA polymerase specialized sigma24 family protein